MPLPDVTSPETLRPATVGHLPLVRHAIDALGIRVSPQESGESGGSPPCDARDGGLAEVVGLTSQLAAVTAKARVAEKVLADSGFRSEAVIAAMEEKGVSVYTPVPEPRGRRNRSDPTEEQTEALARWRERMVRAEGASLYARRGQLVEFAFANFRNRGLRQYRVRGPERCEAVTLLHSLTHNMILAQALARRNQKAA